MMMKNDLQKVSFLVLLELTAAFDTADHDSLIQRLHHAAGLTGLVLDWFSSYLNVTSF